MKHIPKQHLALLILIPLQILQAVNTVKEIVDFDTHYCEL